MEIVFKRDTAFRKQFFVPDSFAHPAKMDAQLLLWIVEHYSEVGETILDPMGGSGTMMLGCGLGRNVVLVELEEKFCKMMRDNWEEVKMRPQLGSQMGECQIIQGDARRLEGLLVDKVISSPPYAEAESRNETPYQEGRVAEMMSRSYVKTKQGKSEGQIGNLPYGQIDKVITSPPYANDNANLKARQDKSARTVLATTGMRGEELSGNNIGNLSYGDIDKIITSPPYSEQKTGGEQGAGKYSGTDLSQGLNRVKDDYSSLESQDNIGNLKGDTYLEAMLQVYDQCFRVLRDGGLMILVTKNFIRNKEQIRLDLDTIKICEQAGFKFLERHYRKLPAQSFWRIIYHQKYPDVKPINHEDVLIFGKPLME